MSACIIPAHNFIYEALLTKAKSYLPGEAFRCRAYQNAATRLMTHETNLFSIENRTYELANHLDQYWGPKTATFIENFIKENPREASKPKCLWAPANEPIYKALLEKADSYPADKPYQAKAYRRAAEMMSAVTLNLFANFGGVKYWEVLSEFGNSPADFIHNYIEARPQNPKPTWVVESKCADDRNDDLYNALIARANEREASGNKYSAKHYRDAAAKVLASTRPIPSSPSWGGYTDEELATLGGPSVVAFIKNHIYESLCPTVLKPTEDDIIKRTIRLYCYKNNLTYLNVVVDEYKAWRPTARSWALENYDYKTDKTSPKTTEEVVKYWLEMEYSETLRAEKKENSYDKYLKNYCKKNNIVYQPLMLERLNAWRNDPVNKDKLVNTVPGCGCSAECEGGKLRSYPMGPAAVINKWFQTLPKTVSL